MNNFDNLIKRNNKSVADVVSVLNELKKAFVIGFLKTIQNSFAPELQEYLVKQHRHQARKERCLRRYNRRGK